MIELKLKESQFLMMVGKGISTDSVCMLKMIAKGLDITKEVTPDKPRAYALFTTLVRRQWVREDFTITPKGHLILGTKGIPKDAKAVKELKKDTTVKFDDWWLKFPRTDKFEAQGKVFDGIRGLRISQDKCRKKFNDLVKEGRYSPETIIRATECDIHLRKMKSLKTNKNQLKFMRNSLTYLGNQDFDPFVDISIGMDFSESQPTKDTKTANGKKKRVRNQDI